MEPLENSAARLLTLLVAITRHPIKNGHATNSIEDWILFLRAYTGHGNWKVQEVSHYILAAHEQITTLEKQLRKRGVPKDAYDHALKQARTVLSTATFSEAWGKIQPRIDALTTVSLSWASVVLDKVETQLSEDELDEMYRLIDDLEGLLNQVETPVELREAVEKHIEGLKVALDTYSIGGANALKESLERSLGALHGDAAILKAAASSGDESQITIIQKMNVVFEKTVAVVSKATTATTSLVALGNGVKNLAKMIGISTD